MIKAAQTILAADFSISLVAGEALTANDAVYIKTSDGKAYKCDADDVTMIGFVGFAQETVSSAANVTIKPSGIMTGFSGMTIGAQYYLSTTAGAITSTKPTNFKLVGVALSATVLRITTDLTERKRVYNTSGSDVGSSTTRFDITNPAGTTFRYTWDGTGTDPVINSGTFPIGTAVMFNAQNFSAANNGLFLVTGVGANYVEVTNASGVAENDKTIGTGYVKPAQVWTKPGNLQYIRVKVQAGGGGGGGNGSANGRSAGGGGGGYSESVLYNSQLNATEPLEVGRGGLAGASGATGGTGRDSIFGSYLRASGGTGGNNGTTGGIGGIGTLGEINLAGGGGQGGSNSGAAGMGGSSVMGGGGYGIGGSNNGNAGQNYGGGGSGAASGGSPQTGGAGADGVIELTEFY